jgi:hypothetical protein
MYGFEFLILTAMIKSNLSTMAAAMQTQDDRKKRRRRKKARTEGTLAVFDLFCFLNCC